MEQEGRRALVLPKLPGLDGLRGTAVVAVLLYHGGFRWARGGHLGVTAFFTLSGFLITALLLLEREREGRIDLKAFWRRRLRRLVPAALVTFGLVAAFAAFSGERLDGLLADGVAAASWVANWRFILDGQSYADAGATPSPFRHYWSLAVEEQLYLVLPLLAVACLGWWQRSRRWLFALVLAAGVIASTLAASALHGAGGLSSRAYYGTDARIAEPLLGALLALAMVGRQGLRRLPPWLAGIVDGAAMLACAGLVVMMATLPAMHPRLYQGGFLLAAALTAVVLTSCTQPGTLVGQVLSFRPLRELGRISYGTYLFHWPVFLWLDETRTGLGTVPLFAARVVVSLALASASYWLLERPIRSGLVMPRFATLAWANATVAVVAVIAVAATVLPTEPSLFLGAMPYSSSAPVVPVLPVGGATAVAADAGPRPAPSTPPAPASTAPAPTAAPTTAAPRPRAAAPTTAPSPTSTPQPPPFLRVAVVGDSMAANLGHGLELWSKGRTDIVIYNLGLAGCPVSRGGLRRNWSLVPAEHAAHCGWWGNAGDPRSVALTEFDPDVLIVADAYNAMFDRYQEEWGEFRTYGDPRLASWLASEYRELAGRFTTPGDVVLQLNAACMDRSLQTSGWRDQDDAPDRVAWMNNSVYQPPAFGPQFQIVDFMGRLCPGGAFTQTVEGVSDARPDGMHLVDEASTRLAANWLGPLAMRAAGRAI